MTGSVFVGLTMVVLILVGAFTIYVYLFGKSKQLNVYTHNDEKKLKAEGIETNSPELFKLVLASLRDINPWFKGVMLAEDYYNEALSITKRLPECKNRMEFLKIVDDELYRWRGYGSLNPSYYDRLDQVSKKVWPLVNEKARKKKTREKHHE